MKSVIAPTTEPVTTFFILAISLKCRGIITNSYQIRPAVTVIQRITAGYRTILVFLSFSFFLTQSAAVSITIDAISWLAPENAGQSTV